jgi:hypothetical protein
MSAEGITENDYRHSKHHEKASEKLVRALWENHPRILRKLTGHPMMPQPPMGEPW